MAYRSLAAIALVALGLAWSAVGALPVAAASPQTSYSFVSAAGDYIGGGLSASYTPPTATFTVSGTASSLTFSVKTATEWWNIQLAAPAGEAFRPASYLNAERAAFKTGRAVGLDVSGDGRGCNNVYGSLSINQINVDSTGKIIMLDATFTQNCESATAAPLNGTVKYDVAPLSYAFTSDAGSLGGGQSKSYFGGTSIFGIMGTTSAVTYTVSGQRDYWTILIAAPAHKKLKTGTTYTGAVRVSPTGTEPILNVSFNSSSCNTSTGSFTINALETDAKGNVTALDATFEHHCEGLPPAVHGTIYMSGIASLAASPVTLPSGPFSTVAQTGFSYSSAPGDYIGQGGSATYTDGTVTGTTASLSFLSSGWTINLAAPAGEQLHPGSYYNVERAVFRTGRAAGLDVFGQGRGCNQVWGSFGINQIGADSAGNVTMLDATFVQNCESSTAPPMQGSLKFNASPLSYGFVSDSGDFIGQGQTRAYGGATTIFGLGGTSAAITFTVSGLRDNWTINLAAPTGSTLAVGTYLGAQRYPFNGTAPGLSVSGDGRGCNTLTGSFTINAITTDQAGNVTTLNATFEQHCEGATPALRGTINFGA